jgi:hypothetical protein
MTSLITPAQAVQMLNEHRAKGAGRVFGVTFVKRTDNTLKTLNARFGVTAHLKGGKRAYNPAEKGLMTVWDVNGHSYKTINLSGLRALTVDGQEFKVI